jgi:hypothetical protein
MGVMQWLRLGMGQALPATSDQRGILTVELGDDATADQLVWVGKDNAGAYAKTVLAVANVPAARTVFNNVSANAADTPSTTNTATLVQAYVSPTTLPAGTWEVRATGWLGLKQSAGNNGQLRIQIDGNPGGTRNVALNSSSFQTVVCHAVQSNVAGGRSINVLLEYCGTTSGTTSAQNPALVVFAQRTA